MNTGKDKNKAEEKAETIFGLNLTPDDSLSMYANDKFIVEQTEIANRKFKNYRPGTYTPDPNV